MLAQGDYKILSLDEGLRRLQAGKLPPRSVVLTFDDGFHDFAVYAAPLLKEYGFPATIYLTTYYVDHQRPIFRLILSYLLWKGQAPGRILSDGSPLSGSAEAAAAHRRILEKTAFEQATTARKLEIAQALAAELGIDFAALLERRILHLMSPEEVTGLAQCSLFTFESHTHRHRTPAGREDVVCELRRNQDRIEELTGRRPRHFCYPSGVGLKEFSPLLKEEGFVSAVNCEAAIATPRNHPFWIPRMLDRQNLNDAHFCAWLSGLRAVGRTC